MTAQAASSHRTSGAEAKIVSQAEAQTMVAELHAAMDDLLELLAEETRLVKAGKLKDAAALAVRKEERAADYTRLMLVARDEVEILQRFDPVGTEKLRRRHELFRAEVQINLAVLATARDVAEDMMRAVAAEAGATEAPSTYGRLGEQSREPTLRGFAIDRNF